MAPFLRCSIQVLLAPAAIWAGFTFVPSYVAGCHVSPPTNPASLAVTALGIHRQQGVPLWYQRLVERDVTGDDRVDSLLLRAYGRASDSLEVVFTIRSDGHEIYRSTWESSDELLDVYPHPPLPRNPPRATVDTILRTALDNFFTRLRVEPLDTSLLENGKVPSDCPHDNAECDAVVDDLRHHTTYQISFSHAYEVSRIIAWSRQARRFFKLWGCC